MCYKLATDDQENSAAVCVVKSALGRKSTQISNHLTSSLFSRKRFLKSKESPKHDMTTILLKLLNKGLIHVSEIPGQVPHAKTTAVVIDFMQCL